MDEAVKALQEAILSANINTSLSDMENLKVLIDSFKVYPSSPKDGVEKEVEKGINDKKMLEIEKCALAHKNFQENLKDTQGCVDEAKALYQYGMKWPRATQSIRKEMDSIDSQINIASSAYDLELNLTRDKINFIEDLYKKLF